MRKNRRNYGQILLNLKRFFGKVCLNDMEELDEVQQEYYFLLRRHEMEKNKCVPMYKIRKGRRKDWFTRCEIAKQRKMANVWKSMRRRPSRKKTGRITN